MSEPISVRPTTVNPPIYKQGLVGILVGCTLGPAVGWFAGTFGTLYLMFLSENFQNGPRSRWSIVWGGLLGAFLGVIVGPLVGVPVRLIFSTIVKSLTNFWVGAAFGGVIGLGVSHLIHLYWNPLGTPIVFLTVHSFVVGAAVGGLAVIAKPKW